MIGIGGIWSALLLAVATGVLSAIPGPPPMARPPVSGTALLPDATLYIPPAVARSDRPAPLMLVLPGTGGSGRALVSVLQPVADRLGVILLGVGPRGRNFDAVEAFFNAYEAGSAAGRTQWPVPRFGGDVARIDKALRAAFARVPVDPARVGIFGFSHGASYALSLGAANPCLFRFIAAMSPGIMVLPENPVADQTVYLAHGRADAVQPFKRTHDAFAPRLQKLGFHVATGWFDGGHELDTRAVYTAFAQLAGLGTRRDQAVAEEGLEPPTPGL